MLASVGYDPTEEVMLVQFQKGGGVYKYNGVPAGVFVAVITDPESQGKAFNEHVKSKDFPFEKLSLKDVPGL